MNQIGDWYATTAPENKYQYNGKELNEELGLNWNDYGARYYDPAIARWGQIDPLAEEYYPISTYAYVANNPNLFIDPDGMQIDLGSLSDSEREQYNSNISKLRENELFNVYYTRLEKSETVYYIKSGSGAGGSGSFNNETKEVHAINDLYTLGQELFHAFQSDLGVYDKNDLSVRETEGDLISTNITTSLGEFGQSPLWDEGLGFKYVDNDLNFDESVLTKEFDKDFNSVVDNRIEFYKAREKNTGAEAPFSYIQKNSGKGAKALKKVVREAGANKMNIVGPRLPNGDFYSN